MRHLICGTFLICGLIFAAGPAFAVGLEVAAGGWSQSPGGNVSYQNLDVSESLDLVNNAGYDDENRFSARAKLDLPILPNFYFMATPMEYEGVGSKAIDFDFGGTTFTADSPFYSKATLNHYDLAMYFEMPLLETVSLNTFNLEFGINVRMLDVDIKLQETSGLLQSAQVDETIYLPMVYLGFQFRPVEKLAFEAELRGIKYSDSSYYDLIGRVKFKVVGLAFLTAGYRYETIEIDEKDIRADLDFSGPFAEVGFDL